jgi:hypothetical protein
VNLSKSVAELQREHVVLELECIDRMYLNAYVPQLTSEAGVAGFVRGHLNTHSKQYHKAAKRRAGLRTETTVNNTYDFGIGRRLCNLPALRQIGFEANRRILEVEKLSHDCGIGQQSFLQLQRSAEIEGPGIGRLPDDECNSFDSL